MVLFVLVSEPFSIFSVLHFACVWILTFCVSLLSILLVCVSHVLFIISAAAVPTVVFTNSTSISLTWGLVSGATSYGLVVTDPNSVCLLSCSSTPFPFYLFDLSFCFCPLLLECGRESFIWSWNWFICVWWIVCHCLHLHADHFHIIEPVFCEQEHSGHHLPCRPVLSDFIEHHFIFIHFWVWG